LVNNCFISIGIKMEKKRIIAAIGLFIGLGVGVGAAHATTLYQFFNGREQQFVTDNHSEGVNAGWRYEGIAWTSFNGAGRAHLLYRCLIPSGGGTHHFVSVDPGCEGQRTEGNYGYAATDNQPGLYPLYRYFANSNIEGHAAHLITRVPPSTIPSDSGYVLEGILGYVH
jgi:hypothetical protein